MAATGVSCRAPPQEDVHVPTMDLGAIASAAMLAAVGARPSADAPAFDFHSGNAGIEVIIPAVIPALFQTTTLNDRPPGEATQYNKNVAMFYASYRVLNSL